MTDPDSNVDSKVDAPSDRSAAADLRTPEARIGTVVDKYSIVGILGQGGMGAVYEARHATLARRFAIKFLLPAAAANSEALRRFENEAKAAGGLEHPNLIAVTDFGRDVQGAPYIVMEYLVGEDCAKLLDRLGPLPVARAVNIVQQACRGLAVAHKASIVHRDLKPANLFLTDAGDGSDQVKVLDFGIAKLKASDAGVATGTGEAFGTAHYMSPEQARGAGEVDARTDVWSLGVVLYELLTGRKPFEDGTFLHVIYQILSMEPPSAATLRKDLAPALVAIIDRAMAKDARDRFPSVLALAEALAPFAAEGRSAGVAQRSRGFAATMATPVTGLRPARAPAESELAPGLGRPGVPSDARNASTLGARKARGKTKVAIAVAVAVTVAAAVGAVVKLNGGRAGESGTTAAGPSHEPSAPRAAESPPAPATVPLPLSTGLAAPSAVHLPAVSPSEAGAALATAALGGAHGESDGLAKKTTAAALPGDRRTGGSNGRLKTSVRTVSEHSEHGSHAAMAADNIPASKVPASGVAPGAVPKPASLPAIGSQGHPIDIDETSPYGR